MPALPFTSTYGQAGTWNTEDPEGEGFAGVNEDGPPRKRQVFRGAQQQSRFAVNPTLFGTEANLANANSNYLSATLPATQAALQTFDLNYLGSGNAASIGAQRPRWIRNNAGGYQTAPGPNAPIMTEGPTDAQLITKSPITGRPWADSPLIPPGYKPADMSAQRARWGWGGLS